MQFPKDAVLVKTISLDVLDGKQLVEKRVETQLLHFDGDDWRGYSYAWRDDQSDADLVPTDGTEKVFPVAAGGRVEKGNWTPLGKHELVWTFHSRTQCISCHNSWSEYALAFTTRQLNRPPLFGGGTAPNQLVHLTQQGYAKRIGAKDKELPPFDKDTVKKEPAHAPLGSEVSLDARARSYLHVNCAHCHRFGGGGGQVVLELDVDKPLKETAIFNVRPKQGDFGLPDARIVAPGDPYRSVLFYRMAKFGRGRMPHLGSEWPHVQGLDLMAKWIAALGTPAKDWPVPLPDMLNQDQAYVSFEGAWPFAQGIRRLGKFDSKIAGDLAADAAKHAAGPVHELFEGTFRRTRRAANSVRTRARGRFSLSRGTRRTARQLVLQQGNEVRQLPQSWGQGHRTRPGPDENRQDPHADGTARQPAEPVGRGWSRSSPLTT